MGLTLGAIVLNVPDTAQGTTFWSQALNYTPQASNPAFLAPPDQAATRIHLDSTDRTHLDLWLTPGTSLADEIARLEALGAEVVTDWTYPDGADFTVLKSPDGTIFCIIHD